MSEKLGAEQGRETAMNKNNYCSYQTATHYCGKQGGHTGEHYLYLKLIAGHRANCINFRDEAMCDCGALEPQTEQAYHARGAGALIAPIEALIEYHEKYATSHVSSQWIYGENMMVVQAYKKVLQMIETLREPGADTGAGAREEALFRAASTAVVNLATSMNLREHPDSCECYGCGLNRAVVNFALARARENVRPIVERELQAERWPGADTGTTPLDLRSAGGVETTRLMSKEECERIYRECLSSRAPSVSSPSMWSTRASLTLALRHFARIAASTFGAERIREKNETR